MAPACRIFGNNTSGSAANWGLAVANILTGKLVTGSQTTLPASFAAGGGKSGTVVIRLDSPPGKEPLALQWDLEFAATALHLDFANLAPGEAAKSTGKSVACSLIAREKQDRFEYRCILAGGIRALASGPIVTIPYSEGKM
jgi:hypothetical protein